jgi:hypothetical protein
LSIKILKLKLNKKHKPVYSKSANLSAGNEKYRNQSFMKDEKK